MPTQVSCAEYLKASLSHHRGALAQSAELRKLCFLADQMDRGTAFAAITNMRCTEHRFQSFPALCAVTIQMALDRDVHATTSFMVQRDLGVIPAWRQVRTRCTSYPDQRDRKLWCV